MTDKSQPTRQVERSRPSERGRGERVVVGWDDVLCRPIYKDIIKGGKCRQEKGEAQNSPNSTLLVPKVQQETNGSSEVSTRQVPPPAKKRCYGKPRKERIALNDDRGTDGDRMEVPFKPSMVNNKEKQDPDHNGDGEPHEQDKIDKNDASVFDFKESDSAQILVTRQPKTCRTPPKDTVQSVSSNTSLSVAKEFFSKLDSQHNLTISAESSVSPHRRRIAGRSTRIASSLTTRVLAEEYAEYKVACETSAVTPLPKEFYITNRSSFFRSDAIYDGFLDE